MGNEPGGIDADEAVRWQSRDTVEGYIRQARSLFGRRWQSRASSPGKSIATTPPLERTSTDPRFQSGAPSMSPQDRAYSAPSVRSTLEIRYTDSSIIRAPARSEALENQDGAYPRLQLESTNPDGAWRQRILKYFTSRESQSSSWGSDSRESSDIPCIDPLPNFTSPAGNPEVRPNGQHRRSMAPSPPKFDDSRLETRFFRGYVVHKREISAGMWEESIWDELREIGRGGSGSVWLQSKRGGGELRAVKGILKPPEGFSRSQELLAFVELKDDDHHFVRFFGWYADMRSMYLVMEYLKDGDLSEYIRQYPKESINAKEITRQVLEGLRVIHEKKIYHRDIKPQNILIARLDPIWIKIADFGAAKQVIDTTARTRWGTECYRPPEIMGIISQEPKGPKFPPYALDIWPLGSLVHELLTSQTPFTTSTAMSLRELGYGTTSGIATPKPGRRTDMRSLMQYCNGSIELPVGVLEECGVDKDGIAFVKSLLAPNPLSRPTVAHALKHLWLKKARSDLPRDPHTAYRQPGGDTNSWFVDPRSPTTITAPPTLEHKEYPHSLLEAAENGHNSVLLMYFNLEDREPIDSLIRGKLFQVAAKAKQYDTIEFLLSKKVDVGAHINNRSVLQWAAKAGHANIVGILLRNKYDVSISTDCWEAFYVATKTGHIDVIRIFLENGFDIGSRSGQPRPHKKKYPEDFSGEPLQVAAGNGRIDIVKLLLDNKADVNADIGYGTGPQTALQAAAMGGHSNIIELLLQEGATVNTGGPKALQFAAGNGNINIVKLLLKMGADVNANPQQRIGRARGRTALQAAAGGGHIDIVKLLLDNKADVNAPASEIHGRTALQAAAEGGHIGISKLLLEKSADVNAKAVYEQGRTALQAAAGGGHIDIARLLLNNKADVNSPASEVHGRTALQAAAGGGHIGIVKLLLEGGADVNALELRGLTALQAAAKGGHIDIVKLLLDNNATMISCPSGQTTLQVAVDGGNISIVKLLLANKADVNAPAGFNFDKGIFRTALQAAAEAGDTDIVKLLLDFKANVNVGAKGDNGRTALQAAAEYGHIDTLKLLLINKADVNAAQKLDLTALQAAAGHGHIDIVKILLDHGANANATSANFAGQTALKAAAMGGYIGVAKLLLDNGANVEGFSRSGTALQAAAEAGHIDIVKLLLDNKADPNGAATGFYADRTALEAAAMGGNIDIVKLLLKNKANVNCLGRYGIMAAAVTGGNFDIVKLLLENKADVNGKSYLNQTALLRAIEDGRTEIVRLLLDNKANLNYSPEYDKDRSVIQVATECGYPDIAKMVREEIRWPR